MFCPVCGNLIIRQPEDRWEVCHTCGCVFKLLNTPEQQRRGY
jgi:hypothetical protein